MARVVQHRGGPPYLLIVFVFLFLISTTLAVIAFTKSDDKDKLVASQDEQITTLEKTDKAKDDLFGDLSHAMTGTETPPEAVLASYKDLQANLELQGGLLYELQKRHDLLQAANKLAEEQRATIAAKGVELEDKDAAMKKMSDETEAEIARIQDEKLAETTEKKSLQDAHTKQMEQLNGSLEKVRGDLQKQIQERDAKIEKLILKSQEMTSHNAKLLEQVAILLDNLRGREQDIINDPDGQIKKVALDSAVCYVNLGAKDKVRQGMTFAVYSPGAANKDDYKAKIRVSQVSDNICECKIIEQKKDDPIQTDDNVANLAFHVVKTYIFVVKGEFDLHGGMRPSAVGTKEAEDAIRGAGGKIVPDVTVQTDFVVMGDAPPKPVKPADDALANVWKAYQVKVQRYKAFVDTKKAAAAWKIPLLNTNRFMTFMGYLPDRKPISD